MKKTFKSLLSIFLAVFVVVSLVSIPSSAAGINKSSITLTKGYQTTLKFSGSSSVTWSTGDKSVATVSSKGKVVGKSAGTTYIYAKSGGKTYKCKVNVIPSKITASKSNVEIDEKGQSAVITLTVKGSHNNLTVASTDQSVATASWVKPWNGDKIGLKITGKNEGSCRIKIYNKSYSSTCYKYIDVSVGGGLSEEDSNIVITPSARNVAVESGKAANITVYCSDLNQLMAQSYNSNIATVTAGTSSGSSRSYTISGVAAGTTVIRFYDKGDTKNYADVTVTVGSNVQYYEFYTSKPASTLAANDQIKQIQANNATYYVVVPANYDPANLNTRIAEKFGYQYYMVYDKVPASAISAGDTYKEFYHSNTSYAYGKRYILVPMKYDEVKYETAMAVYNNKFDYYKVYSEKPTIQNSWSGDMIEEWTVKDANGKDVKRYALYNWADKDYKEKLEALRNADKAANNVYNQYVVYTSKPNYNTSTEELIMFTKDGLLRYIVAPKNNVDILKRNDLIRKETGIVRPYVIYSESITADASKGEAVEYINLNGKNVYVLTYPSDANYANDWSKITTNTPAGT